MKKIIHWAEPNLGEEEAQAVKEVVESGWIGGNGPRLRMFEKEFARVVGAKYAIGVNNGTSALLCALMALRESHGPFSTTVPSFTFIATANTAKEISKEIHLVDVDKKTWNISGYKPSDEVIIPVDVAGLPCEYDELLKTGKILLEDGAEAIGSIYKGRKVGNIADITIFSLHSAKVITTGEGGMITTNDKLFYETMASITNQGYGSIKNPLGYDHERIGFNFRMAEPQAAIGIEQLKKLPRFLKLRKELVSVYKDELRDKVEYQYVPSYCEHSYFFFGILIDGRDDLAQFLLKKGIETRAPFKPIHFQKPYLPNSYHLTNTEKIYERMLALPLHNNLSEEEVKEIGLKVRKYLK